LIKVLVVDDVALIKNGLKYVLEACKEIEVVGTAAHGKEAFDQCVILQPDIVLMDLKMPEVDGVEGTCLIKNSFPHIKVIILTTFKEDEDIKAAISSGADGYVLKDIEPEELIMAIKNTHKGLYTLDKTVFEAITRKTKPNPVSPTITSEMVDQNGKSKLSSQDIEIIRHLMDGKSYKEISQELYLSEGHVRNQVSRILKKLDLTDRMQLSLYAVKNKLL
jgi:DNA-binding NarL/FixJ family response regulator